MIDGARVAVTMPGLNVAPTLERTLRAVPEGWADVVILADDGSTDDTVAVARSLGIEVVSHEFNRGYGAAQKSSYKLALELGADIAVMVHPDFQYKPELVPALAAMVRHGGYDLVLASRMLDGTALSGGMPAYKLVANRILTHTENALLGGHLSEYHTGYRAFSRRFLEELPLARLADGFSFDSESVAVALLHGGMRIGEISCPTHYFEGMQTISFTDGVRYGMGCLRAAGAGALARLGVPVRRYDLSGPTLAAWNGGVRQP